MRIRKPDWLKIKLTVNEELKFISNLLKDNNLNTVCVEARCPNLHECWARGIATFMICGDICTRNCRFCSVKHGIPSPLDEKEPEKIANVVKKLGLRYCVLTSVTRDDLPDGGAKHWADTVETIRKVNPGIKVEVLVPDFEGDKEALDCVFNSNPDVFAHNLETIKELYKKIRPQADYHRSLDLLKIAKNRGFITKTGIMVGLGEAKDKVFSLIDDISEIGVDIFTVGQYLQPTKDNLPVYRYVPPYEFDEFKSYAVSKGIKHVFSAPLVRSSYHAEDVLL